MEVLPVPGGGESLLVSNNCSENEEEDNRSVYEVGEGDIDSFTPPSDESSHYFVDELSTPKKSPPFEDTTEDQDTPKFPTTNLIRHSLYFTPTLLYPFQNVLFLQFSRFLKFFLAFKIITVAKLISMTRLHASANFG